MATRSDLNTTALAYLGDAVYEVIIRGMILEKFPQDAGKAHKHAVKYVSAEGHQQLSEDALAKLAECYELMKKGEIVPPVSAAELQ